MTKVKEFEYKGYMSKEAQEFFKDKLITEDRDGCAVFGSFVRLISGKMHLPSKGDKFKKCESGSITVETIC